jgi:hypothetical protein
MESVSLRSSVGPSGILHLDIPSGFSNVELEVMVILQPLSSGTSCHVDHVQHQGIREGGIAAN